MIRQMHSLAVLAAVTLASAPATAADYLCSNNDGAGGQVKIQAFTLSAGEVDDSDAALTLAPVKAAAILKLSGWKVLLTGSVSTIPDRVGGRDHFNLTGPDGSAVSLRTVSSFLPVNCTRVDCQWRETVTGTLTVDGVTHALQCSKTLF